MENSFAELSYLEVSNPVNLPFQKSLEDGSKMNELQNSGMRTGEKTRQ